MQVELREWSINDWEALVEICHQIDRRYLSDRLPDPYTKDCAMWWLDKVKESEGQCGVFREIVVDGKIVGTISVEQKEDVYRKDADIGYFLLPNQSGQGIMSEAVRQICDIAFQTLDIMRMTGLVYKPNMASRKVLEKNGFVLEGIMKNAVIKNEKIYDLCVYGKLKS